MALVLAECDRCKNPIPLDWPDCPHCGGRKNCPNVVLATQPAEIDALEKRYQASKSEADKRGTRQTADEFESAAAKSKAVLGSSLNKLKPIVLQDRHVFATYHELANLRFHLEPAANQPDFNNIHRPSAEIALLGSYKHMHQLHYAALSIDGKSLPHYGECTIVLRTDMIAHRASVFQENSGVYVYRNGNKLPFGSRSIWENRGKLCLVKVADQITVTTKVSDFPKLLLNPGPTAIDDSFVEVHIFGPMTFRSFEKMTVRKAGAKPSSTKRPRTRRGTTDELALKSYCKAENLDCEIVS